MRRNFCQACSMNRFGATTRLECTCGQSVSRKKHQYVPTREELDKYLCRLKTLMRRNDLSIMAPAEKAIQEAVWEVDKLPADIELTNAINLLQQAKDKVSDYLDKVEENTPA